MSLEERRRHKILCILGEAATGSLVTSYVVSIDRFFLSPLTGFLFFFDRFCGLLTGFVVSFDRFGRGL